VKPFVVNRHGRIVIPATFLGALDFSAIDTLEQLTSVIGRDFEAKAPTGADILARIESAAYPNRFALLRDLGQNLYWVNRYALPMLDKRPTRWRDLPRGRADVFLPLLTPWEDGDRKVAAVERAYAELPAAWDTGAEDRIFALLFDVFRHKRHHATELPPIPLTVAEMLATPEALTLVLPHHDPDYRVFGLDEILDAAEDVPELEALTRWAMVLHNQHPWERAEAALRPVSEIRDDEFVIALHPRDREVAVFIDRVRAAARPRRPPSVEAASAPPVEARPPVRPYPPLRVREVFGVLPRLEALSVVRGEHICTNADVIRSSSFSWSPMSAEEIRAKTGIEQRRYSVRRIEELAFDAAQVALSHAGRAPEDIGAVIVATCTSDRLIPSIACWLSGELGMLQTHASVDLVAACAGLPYGLAEAVRLLQEVQRPVLLVCAEKFSDKIGAIRTSRMIFGDGASAIVVGPAEPGSAGDLHVLQTYAGGPASEVNSIIWPNPAFDNDITVYGPEVKSLVRRYLDQMMSELGEQRDPDAPGRSVLAGIELIVPHQANKTMVVDLARKAGLAAEQLYFNIATMGNVSAASIPIALHDAVRDGVISRPTRVFAPGFGAGAVGGYAVMTVDPAIVAPEVETGAVAVSHPLRTPATTTSEDVRVAFGE
jgi:3-oxoacyl-[acyl-carrier-protein] synthase-3